MKNLKFLKSLVGESRSQGFRKYLSNTSTEFTTLLMSNLEELTKDQPWGNELRISFQGQLVDFLDQLTSRDPECLVQEYQRHMDQVLRAQMQRLRVKFGHDKKAQLRESGSSRRIITCIPAVAQETFNKHVFNRTRRSLSRTSMTKLNMKKKVGKMTRNTLHQPKTRFDDFTTGGKEGATAFATVNVSQSKAICDCFGSANSESTTYGGPRG